MNNDSNGYFRNLSSHDPRERPACAEYYTDDEIENEWVHSRDEEEGELLLGEE